MERINLTPRTKFVLPVSFNGSDYDIQLDSEDTAFAHAMPQMGEIATALAEKYKADGVDFSALDAEKNDACNQFYSLFCSFCPQFAEITGNVAITSLSVWIAIFNCITGNLKNLSVDAQAIAEIKKEESDAVAVEQPQTYHRQSAYV